MMLFRILKNGDGHFEVQRKLGWFWYRPKKYIPLQGFFVPRFKHVEHAREFAEEIAARPAKQRQQKLDEEEKFLRENTWDIVEQFAI